MSACGKPGTPHEIKGGAQCIEGSSLVVRPGHARVPRVLGLIEGSQPTPLVFLWAEGGGRGGGGGALPASTSIKDIQLQVHELSGIVWWAAVIVSNHVSYLDILVHMSHSAPSFVARGNTADLPLIGVIRWGPCVSRDARMFESVERR